MLINSIKPAMNNPEIFDKWLKDECIEFKKPLIQRDITNEPTPRSSRYSNVRLITFNVMLYTF